MNENYRIFGKIISILNKDHPPRVSKNFMTDQQPKITCNHNSDLIEKKYWKLIIQGKNFTISIQSS